MLALFIFITTLRSPNTGPVNNPVIQDLFINYHNEITIDDFPNSKTISTSSLDVKKRIPGTYLGTWPSMTLLGPILFADRWTSFRFYYVGHLNLINSINSYLVYTESMDSERYLFLINTFNKQLRSAAVVSGSWYLSDIQYHHSYCTINTNVLSFFDKTIIQIDDCEIDAEVIRIPLLIRVYLKVKKILGNLFSKSDTDYSFFLQLRINNQGFFDELYSVIP